MLKTAHKEHHKMAKHTCPNIFHTVRVLPMGIREANDSTIPHIIYQ